MPNYETSEEFNQRFEESSNSEAVTEFVERIVKNTATPTNEDEYVDTCRSQSAEFVAKAHELYL